MVAPATRRSMAWSSCCSTDPATSRMRRSISTCSVPDANGYFTLGNLGVPGVDLIVDPNVLQNGADAVALFAGSASDFPPDTPVTTANLLDAIIYDTDDADDPGLAVLLNPGQPQVNENGGGSGVTQSSQRCPDGAGGARNTSTYLQGTPTPDAVNTCPPPPQPSNSTIVVSQLYGGGGNTGATYHNDFVELYNRGTSAVDLTGWSLQYRVGDGQCVGRQQAASRRNDRTRRVLPDRAGVRRGHRRSPAASEHQRPDQHERHERKDRPREQLRWAHRQLSDRRSTRDGLRRLRKRRLPRGDGDRPRAGQHDVDIPCRQWKRRHQQQRQRFRHRHASAQANRSDRRARAARAEYRIHA